MDAHAASENWRTLRKLLLITVAMFGFGFALVPLYEKICKVTGIRNLLRPDHIPINTQVDTSRKLTVEFDTNTHKLPWSFRPVSGHLELHPGQLTEVMYEIRNTQSRPITGQAIPSYSPAIAAEYFKKLQCFCFDKHTLGPGEVKYMPIVFVVDPALPKSVNTITLSFTFFEVEGAAARKPGSS